MAFYGSTVEQLEMANGLGHVENWSSILIRHFVDMFGSRVTKFLISSLDGSSFSMVGSRSAFLHSGTPTHLR